MMRSVVVSMTVSRQKPTGTLKRGWRLLRREKNPEEAEWFLRCS